MESANPVVAVVENDAAMLKALERLLRASGFQSELFASAESYLARRAGAEIGCLILDIDLGGISGMELQRRLVAAGDAPPIVFVTSQVESAFREQAQALGCVAYLRKPFPSHELLRALELAGQHRAAAVAPP